MSKLRTFDGDDPNAGTDEEGAFGGRWNGPSVVLTLRQPQSRTPGVTFASWGTERGSMSSQAVPL
jgi:hypothetical protein